MPHKYKLDLRSSELGEDICLSGEFSDEEWTRLEMFVEYSYELSKAKFLYSKERGQLHINWEHDSGMTVTTVLPDWDEVIVFLHKFRPFLLQNESTNFYKIHNLLAKNLDNPYFRSFLGQHHELYSGKLMQSRYQISLNDVLINSDKVLFDWLNSHEFHREADKREFIDSLHHMLPLDASKVIFLRLLIDKAMAIFSLAEFIRVVLGKEKSLKLEIRKPE